MINAGFPPNEKDRLQALLDYQILDTAPEEDFDNITRIASEICQTPISLITLLDTARQWFKSHTGMSATETPREYAFCAHAIQNPSQILVVPDSTKDNRFIGNPLVDGDPHVVFYAGVPLVTHEGFALGTLCIIDNHPRELTQRQMDSLKALANQVVIILELRRKNILLEQSKKELDERYNELEKFSYVVSHDLKSPVNNIISIAQLLRQEHAKQLDESGNEFLSYLNDSASHLKKLIDGILTYYRGDTLLADQREEVDLQNIFNDIISLVNAKKEVQVNYPKGPITIYTNKVALEQILLNLIVNSIKYNDKENPVIDLHFSITDDFYHFGVRDNGSGISPDDLQKIFNLFTHLGKKDRDGNMGTGIGLSTVKKMVEKMGGVIRVSSELGKGSEFTFTIKNKS